MLILWSASTTLLCGPQCTLSLGVLTPAEGQHNHRKCNFLGDLIQPFVEDNDCGREYFFNTHFIIEFLTEEEFSSSQASSSLVTQVNL